MTIVHEKLKYGLSQGSVERAYENKQNHTKYLNGKKPLKMFERTKIHTGNVNCFASLAISWIMIRNIRSEDCSEGIAITEKERL